MWKWKEVTISKIHAAQNGVKRSWQLVEVEETRSTLYINWEKRRRKNRRYTIKKIWANNKYDTIPNKCAFHAFLYINYDRNFFIFYFQISWDSYYQTKKNAKNKLKAMTIFIHRTKTKPMLYNKKERKKKVTKNRLNFELRNNASKRFSL